MRCYKKIRVIRSFFSTSLTNTMQKKPPPLNYIRSFECSARHLNFTRAAQELGCTQAAVSMHVRSLEKHIGLDLFQRFPRSLKLTDAGEAYLPSLREALLMIDSATQTVQVSDDYKTVSISAPISFAENWLVAHIASFHKENPEVAVIVHGTVWADADPREVDLSIEMHRHDDVPADGRLVCRGDLALICAVEDAHLIKDLTDIEKMAKVVVQGRQDYWLEYASELQLPSFEIGRAVRANATNIALELVSRGSGITVVPVDLAKTYLDRNLLTLPLPHRAPSPWGYYIRPSNTSNLAAAKKLARWLTTAH